jgi:hypothetical protein
VELEPFNGDTSTLLPAELVNAFLLVWAIDYIPHSPTKFTVPGKASDVIVVDVVNLHTGELGQQVWWRQGRLIKDLKPKIGRPNPILVQMTRGIGTQGGQAPYELVSGAGDPTAVAMAKAWFEANPSFTASTPLPHPQPQVETSAQPLPSEPGQPAWMPAQEHWDPQPQPAQRPAQRYVPTREDMYTLPPPPARRAAPPAQPARQWTQAEQMAQEKEAPF